MPTRQPALTIPQVDYVLRTLAEVMDKNSIYKLLFDNHVVIRSNINSDTMDVIFKNEENASKLISMLDTLTVNKLLPADDENTHAPKRKSSIPIEVRNKSFTTVLTQITNVLVFTIGLDMWNSTLASILDTSNIMSGEYSIDEKHNANPNIDISIIAKYPVLVTYYLLDILACQSKSI